MKKHLSVLALISLTACAVSGQPYSASSLKAPAAGHAQVIVYWPEWMNGFPVDVQVADKTCSVLPNSYVTFNVKAGAVKVYHSGTPTSLKTTAGKRYYVKMSQNRAKTTSVGAAGLIGLFAYNAANHGKPDNGDYRFEVMDASYAQGELSKTKQSGCN